MFDILSIIPGRKKLSSGGWHSFNAICCHHQGHKPDRKGRGGIKLDNGINWTYHCFNCGFSCRFSIGKPLSTRTKQLLTWCGVDQTQIGKWSLDSRAQAALYGVLPGADIVNQVIEFEERELPPDAELIDPDNILHKKYVDYVQSRGIHIGSYPFMCTPHNRGRNSERIIIPYTYENKIVGSTSRYMDNLSPKYLTDQSPGYVFGVDLQKPTWQVCVMVEGVFDALAIDGVALLHNDISDAQVRTLARLNRTMIMVPDHDKPGLKICERALDLGYRVSIPEWDEDVKDVNDAVLRYGKIATLLSILESSTTSKIKIDLMRKKIVKRI